MTIGSLIQELKDTEVYFLGDAGKEVYRTELWDGREDKRPSQDILYVAELSQKAPEWNNLVMVEASRIPDVIEQFRQILAEDYRIHDAMLRLNQEIVREASVREIVDVCHEIMGESVFLFDTQFSLIAAAGEIKSSEILSLISRRKDLNEMTDIQVISPSGENTLECLVCSLRCEGILIGHVLCAAERKRNDTKKAIRRLTMMSQVLANLRDLGRYGWVISAKEHFLTSLLQADNVDRKAAEKRKKELGFPEHDKYYILSFKKKKERPAAFVRDKLEAVLGEEIYEYRQYYFAVTGCKLKERIREEDWPKLKTFLEENHMFVGLSNGFLDFASLKVAFEQSILAVPLRKMVSGNEILFCRYEDLLLSHLLYIADQNHLPYESFCHPNVVYIKRYDDEHGTEYLKTLLTYIFNNLKLAETAGKLFIHRNTLYHRLGVLREQFGIDFENPREIMKLSIACVAYGFTNVIEHSNLQFGPMD